MTYDDTLLAALAEVRDDRIVLDLTGIEDAYACLREELPGASVRFALKACPVDEVLGCLAALGSGADAASPQEIRQALGAGIPPERIHYGNTVKSDTDIAEAYRLGIRDYATDSLADVTAVARHAPGSRVFCRLATDGDGALWGLSRKFGCSAADALAVLERAAAEGLEPAGLSVHVGSQQMTAGAWRRAFEQLCDLITELGRRGTTLRYVNLGGGLPALGYLDRRGEPLEPPIDKIFAVIREGMQHCADAAGHPLDFVVEPGRYLVADHGAIRAHVARLSLRHGADGTPQHWLYLSCGKFNGLYEMDALQYRLVFPGHEGGPTVPARVAGPTCDSDDAYSGGHRLVDVPAALTSGDPVWVLSSGAYAVSYTTLGFNGFSPLPWSCVRAAGSGA